MEVCIVTPLTHNIGRFDLLLDGKTWKRQRHGPNKEALEEAMISSNRGGCPAVHWLDNYQLLGTMSTWKGS